MGNWKSTYTQEWKDEETGVTHEREIEVNFYRGEYGADADGRRGEMRTEWEINYTGEWNPPLPKNEDGDQQDERDLDIQDADAFVEHEIEQEY